MIYIENKKKQKAFESIFIEPQSPPHPLNKPLNSGGTNKPIALVYHSDVIVWFEVSNHQHRRLCVSGEPGTKTVANEEINATLGFSYNLVLCRCPPPTHT